MRKKDVKDLSNSSLPERLLGEWRYDFADVDLAPKVTDRDFAIDFPANSLYRDDSSDETYEVDSSGKTQKVLALDPTRGTKGERVKGKE